MLVTGMTITGTMRLNRVCASVYAAFLVAMLVGSAAVLGASLVVGGSAQLIASDGKQYYAWCRSILLDGDIDFANDYAVLYPPDPPPPEASESTPTGRLVNKYPVGLAILQIPGFLAGHLGAAVLRLPQDGVSVAYQVAVCLWLAVFALVGLWLLFRATRRMEGTPSVALLVCMASAVATNAVHYVAKEPGMAHAAGMALICGVVYDIFRARVSQGSVKLGRAFLWGCLLGLLLLLRNSNLFVFPFIAGLLHHRGTLRFRVLAAIGAGTALVGLLQPLSLYLLWGELRLSTYPSEGFTGGINGLWQTLCGHRHGLFIYHPWYMVLLIFTTMGLFKQKARSVSAAALVSFALLVLANGLWHCWWFGDSFGNRAFVEILPILSIAAIATLSCMRDSRKRVAGLSGVLAFCCLLNMYLWAGYLLQRYPHDGSHTVAEAYGWCLSRQGAG